MTPLESKAKRDSYGIDTFERGFVYAAFLLRASNTDPNNTKPKNENRYYNAVRMALEFETITDEGENDTSKSYTLASILIQAKIPYNNTLALKHGGYFLNYLQEYGNNDPNPFNLIAPPTEENLPALYYEIYDDPVWVNTLEKYLAWCVVNLMCGFEANQGIEEKPIKLQVLEEDTLGSSVLIDAALEFDYREFLQTNNVFCAIKQLTRTGCKFTYIPDNDTTYNANIGNVNIVSNNSLFSN